MKRYTVSFEFWYDSDVEKTYSSIHTFYAENKSELIQQWSSYARSIKSTCPDITIGRLQFKEVL